MWFYNAIPDGSDGDAAPASKRARRPRYSSEKVAEMRRVEKEIDIELGAMSSIDEEYEESSDDDDSESD